MSKSPDAFRTISEVADWLDTPTHVLRFWESRFTQVKPVKRAGGRRYYRPSDMELLGGIKKLLHDDGMTIRGVQKLLREEGIKHVSALAPPIENEANDTGDDPDVYDTGALPDDTDDQAPAPMLTDAQPEAVDNVVPLSRTLAEAEGGRQRDLLDEMPRDDGAIKAETATQTETASDAPKAKGADAARPARIDLPADPEDDDAAFTAKPGLIAALHAAARAPTDQRPDPARLKPLVERLSKLRDRMRSDSQA